MGKYRKKIQLVVLMAIFVVGGYAIVQSFIQNEKSSLVKIGEQAPGFKLANLEGQAVTLEDFAGAPLVLNFWGTFCEPCIREMPTFEEQYQAWADKGVQFLGINLSEDKFTVRNYVKNLGVTYPIVQDVNRMIEKKYGLRSYPTTFFINKDGTLDSVVVGEMTEAMIVQHINQLLDS